MKLDLGDDVAFEVTYKACTYIMREPTVGEIELFKSPKDGEAPDVVGFLTKLGLPQDVAENLPLTKIRMLVEGIVDGIVKKK